MIWLKGKILLIGGAIIAVLAGLLKLFISKAAREERHRKRLESALERQSDIQEIDSELSKDLESEKAKIAKEIEDDKQVDSLLDPNHWP